MNGNQLFDELLDVITEIEQNDFISVMGIYDKLVNLCVAYEGTTNFGKSGETR